jgi:imidazolonepropionase-like amidohydrolase
MAAILSAPDLPTQLGEGHFLWLQAVSERGMTPMAALMAATKNVAEAYGKGADIGTLEPGKRADLVVLSADPLAAPQNYRAIAMVIKDGHVIDRAALPTKAIFTRAPTPAPGATASH